MIIPILYTKVTTCLQLVYLITEFGRHQHNVESTSGTGEYYASNSKLLHQKNPPSSLRWWIVATILVVVMAVHVCIYVVHRSHAMYGQLLVVFSCRMERLPLDELPTCFSVCTLVAVLVWGC